MITRCEYASSVPMSSADPDLTLRPSLPATAAVAARVWPNAPNSTFPSERPIASLISLGSRLPDAPTSVPATISAKLFRAKPLAATARPVNAFKGGDHRGDRGHLHQARAELSGRPADHDPDRDDDHAGGREVALGHRGRECDHHPDRGDAVSVARALGRAELLQPEDEADGRDQGCDLHHAVHSVGPAFLAGAALFYASAP